MKRQFTIFGRGFRYAFIGLGLQILATAVLLAVVVTWTHRLSVPVFWTACAGLPVWMHLIVSYWLFRKETCWAARYAEETDENRRHKALRRRNRACALHHVYRTYGVPLLEIVIILLLIAWAFPFVRLAGDEIQLDRSRLLQVIALYAGMTGGLAVACMVYRNLLGFKAFHLLKSGNRFVFAMALLFFVLTGCLAFDYFQMAVVSEKAYGFFAAFNAVLAAEIAFSIITQFFRPRRTNEMVRPAFDSYLLESLMDPRSTRRTFSDMAHSLFGFDISKTAFARSAETFIIPVVAGSLTLMLAMTSLVIVKPNQQAVRTRFGTLRGHILGPGLHFKLPWPIEKARIENVRDIRRMHVGSHQPEKPGGDVYRQGVPILWTNKHGVKMDELLIVAAPRQLIREAGESGAKINSATHKTPSISLAGADVYIEYIIDDLIEYVRSAADPQLLLQKLAEAQTSRLLYRFDIDTLFCAARLEMADLLQVQIQRACDRNSLGIRIVHAGVTAVHPPLAVAKSFEATVAANQERETKIQQARQNAVSVQVETAGSSAQFRALADLINQSESGRLEGTETIEHLLYQCGGNVSCIIAEAAAYRWSRTFIEKGKTCRFRNEAALHTRAPENYRYSRYLDILAEGLADKRKMMLLGSHDQMLIRLRLPAKDLKRLPNNSAAYGE